MQRYTIHFTGRVQGVGFRFTAQRVAKQHVLAGYVQNLPDGRVRLVAEGQASELDQYLADLKRAMARNIENVAVDTSAATGEFGRPRPGGLDVRY